jgi:hypothetical protein
VLGRASTQPSTLSTNLPGLANALVIAEVRMVWIPGTDYPRAQHVGYPVSVSADGTDTGTTPLPAHKAMIGWRTGCDCGWRGRQFYPRAERLSATGAVPAAVEGWEDATATRGEWVRHIQQAVPELSIYELGRHLTDIRAALTDAVAAARWTGLSWAQIGDAAGVSSAPARRWGRGGIRNEHPPATRRANGAPRPDVGPTR